MVGLIEIPIVCERETVLEKELAREGDSVCIIE